MAVHSEMTSLLTRLTSLLDDRVSTNANTREQHGRDEGFRPSQPPDVVVFPLSTEEVSAVAKVCADMAVPMIPYGVGTSLEGQVMAPNGGVCMDMSRMNEVLQVNPRDLDCVVQAGVTRRQLNTYLRDQGMFFPVDPGADATMGGMASTRASGTNAVRYGTMRENVLGLTVVLADGRVVTTGGRARKSSAGYDLTHLFVGSEGTLGIITELTVRLFGRLEAISAAVCSFSDLSAAVDAVIETIQLGIPVARIELLDEVQMDAVNRYSGLSYAVSPTLFLEFHGTRSAVAEQAELVGDIVNQHGGSNFQWARDEVDRNALWRARHDAAYACKALRVGCEIWPTDVCVPISQLAECIRQTRLDIVQSGLVAPIVGHVGDGNFHVVIVLDTNDPDEIRRANEFNERLIARALAVGGTSTGEHGIGLGKRKHLLREHGNAVELMAGIKQVLDPQNLMNPGKIFMRP